MESQENKTISITPNGLIFLALGGYVGDDKGLNSRENTNKVLTILTEFMQKNNSALIVIEGKLNFVTLKKTKRKKILGIF
jgi:hypothetical protein